MWCRGGALGLERLTTGQLAKGFCPRVNWSRTSFYPCGRKGQLVDGGGFTLQVNWSRGSGWEFHGYRLGLYDICSLLSRLRSSLTGQLVEHLVPHCGSTGPTVTSRGSNCPDRPSHYRSTGPRVASRGSNCPTPTVGQLAERLCRGLATSRDVRALPRRCRSPLSGPPGSLN